MEKLYYIVSLKWTFAEKYKHEGHIIFYGSKYSGYTDNIYNAGRYTQEQIDIYLDNNDGLQMLEILDEIQIKRGTTQ